MKHIHNFRVQISVFINSVQFLNPGREISLVKTNLERASMFLGLCLKYSGASPTPYPESENPQSDRIEKADASELTLYEYWCILPATQTARVKDFRAKIEEVILEMKADGGENTPTTPDYHFSLFFDQAFIALSEAKMWLGIELGRIGEVLKNVNAENLQQLKRPVLPLL